MGSGLDGINRSNLQRPAIPTQAAPKPTFAMRAAKWGKSFVRGAMALFTAGGSEHVIKQQQIHNRKVDMVVKREFKLTDLVKGSHPLSNDFQQHMANEHSPENIGFMRKVAKFKNSNDNAEKVKLLKEIHKDYLEDTGSSGLNLSYEGRNAFRADLNFLLSKIDEENPDSIESAMQELSDKKDDESKKMQAKRRKGHMYRALRGQDNNKETDVAFYASMGIKHDTERYDPFDAPFKKIYTLTQDSFRRFNESAEVFEPLMERTPTLTSNPKGSGRFDNRVAGFIKTATSKSSASEQIQALRKQARPLFKEKAEIEGRKAFIATQYDQRKETAKLYIEDAKEELDEARKELEDLKQGFHTPTDLKNAQQHVTDAENRLKKEEDNLQRVEEEYNKNLDTFHENHDERLQQIRTQLSKLNNAVKQTYDMW